MFEKMDMAESVYEGVVKPSYKNLLGQMTTMLVTAGKREDKTPRHRLIPQWVKALGSAENNM